MMAKYMATCTRTVYETYEVVVEARSVEEAFDIVEDTFYGDGGAVPGLIDKELTEHFTDYVEIHMDARKGEE